MTKGESLNTNDNISITSITSITSTITCSICIDEIDIKDDKNIKTLNCSNKHIFHIICIDNWLNINNICPLCREEINNNNIIKVKKYNKCCSYYVFCSSIIFIGFFAALLCFLFYAIKHI
jgi:hypothetical protein